MSRCRENFSPRSEIMTPSWFINFYSKKKYVYLDNSGAFKDFRIFFMETLGWMFEFSFVK